MNDLTREWLSKAQEDYSVAVGLLRRKKVPASTVCFHCQQAAEKYLKAALQEQGIRFGRTHDLESLAGLGGDVTVAVSSLSDDLKLLSDYAVRYRYPGFDATSRQARSAVDAVRRVRAAVTRLLGV